MIAPTTAVVPNPETEQLVGLTPRGEAARQLYQLVRAVADLAPADRAAILSLLAQALPPTA